MVRAAAVLAVLTALSVYYAVSESLFDLGLWGDVAFVGLVLMPAFFSLTWLAVPFWQRAHPTMVPVAILLLFLITLTFELAGLDVAANFAKFAAVTATGFWVLTFFEEVSWVLLVALLIVPVDIYSVFRGPTKVIVEQQPQVFDALSIAFPLPGEHNSAQLGLPDALLRALPRSDDRLHAAAAPDLGADDALLRHHAGAGRRVRDLGAAGAAAPVGRVPPRQRRPDLEADPHRRPPEPEPE